MKNLKTDLFTLFFFLSFIFSLNAQTKIQNLPSSRISTYHSQKDIVVGMNNASILANLIILQIDGELVKGYYGWAAQGSQELYFIGTKAGNTISGFSYNLQDKSEENFKLTILGNVVSVKSPMGQVKVPANNKDLFEYKNLTVYQYPDKKSKILATDLDLEKKGFRLIELGEMDKLDDSEESNYNVWCKIKNQTMEGWVLGLLGVF